MALNKEITLNSGVTITYHRISSISVRKVKDEIFEVTFVVNSYVNDSYRQTGVSVSQEQYSFNVTKAQLETLSIYDLSYKYLKSLSKFESSQDV